MQTCMYLNNDLENNSTHILQTTERNAQDHIFS